MADRERTWLQRRPFRSVTLEHDSRGAAVVVKRFHHPNRLRRALDRWRAQREFRVLRKLEQGRLPVPHAREVRRGTGGWELRLDSIPGASSLEALSPPRNPGGQVSSPPAPSVGAPTGGWPLLARQLGILLAELTASGWRHADPTLRNVLIDAEGRPWIVDWARARRAPPSPSEAWRMLVVFSAQVRERWPSTRLQRALRAWRDALPPALRPSEEDRALVHCIDKAARLERRRQVVAGLGRWFRDSSRVQVRVHDGERFQARRDAPEALLEDAFGARARVSLVSGTRATVEGRWQVAARLEEHGLPIDRPLVLVRSGSEGHWAAFDRPQNRARDAEHLAALLRDRGLALAAPELRRDQGGIWIAAPGEIQEL